MSAGISSTLAVRSGRANSAAGKSGLVCVHAPSTSAAEIKASAKPERSLATVAEPVMPEPNIQAASVIRIARPPLPFEKDGAG
jgi:hypothetical protein